MLMRQQSTGVHRDIAQPLRAAPLWMRVAPLVIGSLCLGACVNETVIRTNSTPVLTAAQDIPDSRLLDVGVSLFDPGLPKTKKEFKKAEREVLVAGVRRAEAHYMPFVLKRTLQQSGQWGAVRVVPHDDTSVDVHISCRILASDGERLAIVARVVDSTGREWFEREYDNLTGKLSYRARLNRGNDPFQDLYNQVANDMLKHAEAMEPKQLERVRQVSELLFARDLAPDAFDGYLTRDEEGYLLPIRLPAYEDPMVARMVRIREREYLFLDTLDSHYQGFHAQVGGPYSEWRRFSYDQVITLRQLRREATMHKVLGGITFAGGLMGDPTTHSGATQYVGGIYTGWTVYQVGRQKAAQARAYEATLRELGVSFEAEVEPMVLDIEGITVTLHGSVEEQFDEWRRLMREIYSLETGFDVSQSEQDGEDADADNASL